MPDVYCSGSTFWWQENVARALLFLYTVVIPLVVARKLHKANTTGQLNRPEFFEAYGWFIHKYHSGAWYAELVFIYYRIAMSAFAVLLTSYESLCLALMAFATAVMLRFVMRVKPFDDGSKASGEAMTSADKVQAWGLVATLAATAVGFVCAQFEHRGKGLNAVIGVLIALIGAAPVMAGLLESRGSDSEEDGSGQSDPESKPEPELEPELEPETESESESEPEDDWLATDANDQDLFADLEAMAQANPLSTETGLHEETNDTHTDDL
jgi:hypothetical protein